MLNLPAPSKVYCDGGMIPNPHSKELTGKAQSSRSDIGCTWAYCWVDANNNKYHEDWGAYLIAGQPTILQGHFRYCKPDWGLTTITSPLAELLAAIHCIHHLPFGWSGEFCSDSETTIGRLFGINGSFWEWKNVPEDIKQKGQWAVSRLGEVKAVLLDGHPTARQLLQNEGKRGNPVSLFNVYADQLCNDTRKIYMTVWEKGEQQNPTP